MAWGATSRWAVSITAILATIFAVWFVMMQFADPVSQRNADRIQERMTREQVTAIMGRQDGESRILWSGRELQVWVWHSNRDHNKTVSVHFCDGKVEFRQFAEPDRSLSAWGRFVRWVRFE